MKVPSNAKFTDEQGAAGNTERATLFFLSPEKKMHLFIGDSDLVISGPLQTTMERINDAAIQKSIAFRHPSYEWIVLGIPVDGATEINHFVAWDYARGYYFADVGDFYPEIASVAVAGSVAQPTSIIAGQGRTTPAGDVFLLFSGVTNDGADFTIRIREKARSLSAPGVLKVLRHIEPWFKPQATSTKIRLNVYEGWASLSAAPFATFTFDIQAADVVVANPGQIEVFNATTARYPVDVSFVFEWIFTGQKIVTYLGRTAGFQSLPPSESRP